jgi:hypothetical protein
MKLEKLLAENMLRFGTKNLIASDIKPYLMEQTQVPRAIYGKYVITNATVAQLPTIAKTYDPTKGAIKILDGNPWLATQRAAALQKFLIQRFQGQFKIPFDASAAKITQTVVEGSGDKYQFMKATIQAKLQKLPETQVPYKFDILYNFYDINGVPHILVTKGGKGSPIKGAAETTINQLKSQMPAGSILVRQGTGGGGAAGPNALEAVTGIMIPITTGFAAKKKGRLYFADAKQYEAMKTFIATYTDLVDAGDKVRETGDLKGRTQLQSNFTSERGGGGNYIFGDLGSGRSAEVLAGKDAGTTITIKRMEPSKIGNLPGDILPGQEEKWFPIAEIIYPGLFPDNLITIKPDMYAEIFDKIQAQIDELKDQRYRAIEMTAEIQGFASKDAANNRCPQGFQPDHSWGLSNPQQGPITAEKWITL